MRSPLVDLHGRECQAVSPDEETHEWCFTFGDGMALRVAAPWRIMSDGRIALGWEDHGQSFGLDAPMVAATLAASLICDTEVVTTQVNGESGDLSIVFDNGRLLQVFNGSCGYEGWQMRGPGNRTVVAQGGGTIVNTVE